MLTILFESHATSLDNEAGLASGWSDVDVSPTGVRQAREMGERYRSHPFAAVFCSDLKRSYRTAEIAFGDRAIPIRRDRRLRECHYGDWTRRPIGEIEAEKARRITEPFPGGESYEEVMLRFRRFLDDLRSQHEGSEVVLVGHRATWYALEHCIGAAPLPEILARPWSWQPGWIYLMRS